ncbi:asparagine synthase-related protein [Flavobacterium ovatum]|uniref:asparagine synthase-related protein n=1 Tax=Flavobacterium ovatum TaxID=1928857 RepID=UPI003450479D
MKIASNYIEEPSAHFRLLSTGEKLPQIWKNHSKGIWKNIQPEIFEKNVKLGALNRSQCQPVIEDILPVYSGMLWNVEKKILTDPCFQPKLQYTDINDFLEASAIFFDQYKSKHIGVQLSGGFDSSIIITLLKHFKISFSLVGMSSSRYEFRTERYIQELIAPLGKNTVLIDFEDYLPLSQLEKVPAHQHPDMLNLNYHTNKAMAIECQKMGVEVLLTGSGGDNLFAEPIQLDARECTWMPQVFRDSWLDDLAYAPHGIEVVPFYADLGIMNTVYNLRLGQGEDNTKLWARQFFKDFLPQELINYTYCADFWGLYIDGLLNAVPTIRKLFEHAYDITANPYFSSQNTNDLLNQDLRDAQKTMYQGIESRVSLAVWLNGLFEKS